MNRRKCVAASLSSAAEQGPISQASPVIPLSTPARMLLGAAWFGAALTSLADSALSSSSFHHSGLATSLHSSCCSVSKVLAVARAHARVSPRPPFLPLHKLIIDITVPPSHTNIPTLRFRYQTFLLRGLARPLGVSSGWVDPRQHGVVILLLISVSIQ